jgi:hypothetical protein
LKGPNEKGCGELAVQMCNKYDAPDSEKFVLEDFEFDRAIEVCLFSLFSSFGKSFLHYFLITFIF